MIKFKKFKEIIKRYRFTSISIFAVIILIPVLVLAVGRPQEGYRAYKNAVSTPMFSVTEDGLNEERVGFCVSNSSSKDYFVPTAKFSDTQAFVNNKPSGILFVDCVGDGYCAGVENCSNDPSDCGYCSSPTSDPCATSCTASCPCTSSCTINCGGGGSSGGSSDSPRSCTSGAYDFYGSC